MAGRAPWGWIDHPEAPDGQVFLLRQGGLPEEAIADLLGRRPDVPRPGCPMRRGSWPRITRLRGRFG